MKRLPPSWSLKAGIALPLCIALWYTVTAYLPRLSEGDPQYDILYMTGYTPDTPNALRVTVQADHVVATFVGENFGYGWPHIYRLRPTTGQILEVPIPTPADLPLKQPYNRPTQDERLEPHHLVPIPVLEDWQIVPTTSPDGFTIDNGLAENQKLSLWDVGGSGTYISKGTHHIAVPRPPGDGRQSITPLGWVLHK